MFCLILIPKVRTESAKKGTFYTGAHAFNNLPPHLKEVDSIVGFHMTSLKFKLKNLSILLRFYFHDALGQLKTNFHTNFRFKRVLGFVIEYD